MRRTFTFAALFVAAFAFAACSDDDSGNQANNNNNNMEIDASVQQDATAQPDASAVDAAPEADAEALWNCAQIGDCAGNCGGASACISECKAKGCESAQNTFSTLLTCVMGNCITECGANGNQDDCDTCMSTNCGTEMQDCANNTCQ